MTTKHQAPEVTSELVPCPFCGARDGRLLQAFTRATESFAYWSVECLDCSCEIASDTSQEEANAAWNTRATQPLSLTVDADLAQTVAAWRDHFAPDGKRIRLDPANKESLHAVLGRVVAALGEQIAENANCSGDIDRSGLAQEVE